MRSKAAKLVLAWLIVFALAPAAFAQFGGLFSPFSFSFYNGFLNSFFLFPFAVGGCF